LSIRALPLPRPPTNLLIFGSGAQAQAHATLFLKLFPTLTTVIIIIRRPSPRSASLLTSLTHAFPSINFTIGISTYPSTTTADIPPELIIDLSQAVHNANIILTLTPSTRPLFNSVDVTSGTHLVLVGSYKPEMREVDEQLIRRAGVVVVDSKEACGKEAGELISAGVEADGMVELGELLVQGDDGEAAKAKVRSSGDVNVFKSVSLRGIFSMELFLRDSG
jgi:ornithine cyclodeaminase/alanine dehydrogenase-like protein (mu-crystallin family)